MTHASRIPLHRHQTPFCGSVQCTLEITLSDHYTCLEAWSTQSIILLSKTLYPCGETPVVFERLTAFHCSIALSRTFLLRRFLRHRANHGPLEQSNQDTKTSLCQSRLKIRTVLVCSDGSRSGPVLRRNCMYSVR